MMRYPFVDLGGFRLSGFAEKLILRLTDGETFFKGREETGGVTGIDIAT